MKHVRNTTVTGTSLGEKSPGDPSEPGVAVGEGAGSRVPLDARHATGDDGGDFRARA